VADFVKNMDLNGRLVMVQAINGKIEHIVGLLNRQDVVRFTKHASYASNMWALEHCVKFAKNKTIIGFQIKTVTLAERKKHL